MNREQKLRNLILDRYTSLRHSGLQKGNYREIKGLSAVFARVKRKYITDGTVNRCRAVPFYHAYFADCS